MLELNQILELLGYLNSPHFRTRESQFEPESVHRFRLARERSGEKFRVKGFYVFRTERDALLGAKPAVCVAEAPSAADAKRLHRRIWNLGDVPFLLVRLPDEIRIYSGFAYDTHVDADVVVQERSARESRLRSALNDFTAESIDSARIWQAQADKLDTVKRVDRRLLANLKDLALALAKHCEPQLDLPTAHALIGKFVYLRYLRDRNILDDDWLAGRTIHLDSVFGPHATVSGLAGVVEELEARFNGDVFSLELGAKTKLNDSHVRLVASVFAGDKLHSDETKYVLQLHLKFQAYDFQHIPVETLSSIYEQFLHAEEKGRAEGAYYTPEILAEYILSEIETVRQLEPGMKFLDASAGSAVFLVLAYRRLIELELRRTRSVEPMRLREILLESIYGVERQRDACNVAMFSLILTMLNYISPPALHANERFKFPDLLNKRIFCDDFFNPALELPIPGNGFDVVVGNPPWIELKPSSKDETYARQSIDSEKSIAGNRVADAFAVKAGRLLSDDGVAGLLLPASTLFTLEGKRFRQNFFTEFSAARVTDLANLRNNLFGGRVIQPAAIVVYQKSNDERASQPILHYAPFAANQVAGDANELWVLTIHASDIQQVSHSEAATGDTSVWKLALWGTARDARALDRIRQIFPTTLSDFCEKNKWGKKMPREGAQLRHRSSATEELVYSDELKDQKRLDTVRFNQLVGSGLHFSLPLGALVPIADGECYVRKRGGLSGLVVNRPPHLLISATWKNLLYYSDEYFAIPPRQMGISAREGDEQLLRALTVYLGSSLVDYFLFFHVPEWGVYSTFPHVVTRAVRSIPTPDFEPNQIKSLASTHRELVRQESPQLFEQSHNQSSTTKQRLIDQIVFETLSIPDSLRLLIEDFRDNRLPLDQGYSALKKLGQRPSMKSLKAYGRTLRMELERFFLDEASVNVVLLTSPELIHCRIGLNSDGGAPITSVDVKDTASSPKAAQMLRELREQLTERISQWVYMERTLRIYEDDSVQIFKAPRLMDWTRTQALNDADEIIAEILEGAALRAS
ncbi:MAG TPA: N-6 DNA methylase [Pyrinomonadaceae bacterium]